MWSRVGLTRMEGCKGTRCGARDEDLDHLSKISTGRFGRLMSRAGMEARCSSFILQSTVDGEPTTVLLLRVEAQSISFTSHSYIGVSSLSS
jgi:hypothetical protein